MPETRKHEYRIRPVTRYVVTRYAPGYVEYHDNGTASGSSGSSSVVGEFLNQGMAAVVAEAMANLHGGAAGVVWEPMEEVPQALPDETPPQHAA